MSFRRRLLGVFAVLIIATVIAIGWAISVRTREVFERTDTQRTQAAGLRPPPLAALIEGQPSTVNARAAGQNALKDRIPRAAEVEFPAAPR